MAARDRLARAAAEARRRSARRLHGVDPPVVDHRFRAGGSAVFRRAHPGASARPLRGNKKEMRPTENPKSYRQEFLKTILFFLNVMPLVDLGLINLVPDSCDFDFPLS